jgi:hypothetical protein
VGIAAASSIRRTNGTACFGSYSYRATRLTREGRTRYTAVPLQLAAEIGALVGKRGCGAFFTQAAEKESTHPRQIQALEGVAVFPTGAPRPGSRSNHRAKGGRWWGGLVAAYIECGQCCLHQACFAPHGVRQGRVELGMGKAGPGGPAHGRRPSTTCWGTGGSGDPPQAWTPAPHGFHQTCFLELVKAGLNLGDAIEAAVPLAGPGCGTFRIAKTLRGREAHGILIRKPP